MVVMCIYLKRALVEKTPRCLLISVLYDSQLLERTLSSSLLAFDDFTSSHEGNRFAVV